MHKKLTYIITNSDRAGAQKHVLSLIDFFSRRYELELVSGTDGYLTEKARVRGIRTHIFPELSRNISPINDLRALKRLRQYLKTSDPDIVHLHSAKAGFIGRLAAAGLRPKVIYTVHGWPFSEGNSLLKRRFTLLMEKSVAKLTDRFILVSEYDHRLALKYGIRQPDKLHTVHNGIKDLDREPVLRQPEGVFHAVSLARLSRQKNLPCLIRAAARIEKGFRLSIAGSGRLKNELETLITRLGLENRVALVGETTDAAGLLASGDVFVMSSDWEGLPIAMIEACRSGLPIVSTRVGGVEEIVDDGYNGYLVPADEPALLAQALEKLIENPQEAKRMGNRSREIYLEKFGEHRMLSQTLKIYEAV